MSRALSHYRPIVDRDAGGRAVAWLVRVTLTEGDVSAFDDLRFTSPAPMNTATAQRRDIDDEVERQIAAGHVGYQRLVATLAARARFVTVDNFEFQGAPQ